MNFQNRGLTFISYSSFILLVVALKFGECMCYFLIRNWPNLEKKDQMWIFHDLLGARQHSQKSSKKNKTFIFYCYDLAIHKESMVEIFCTIQ